MTFSRATAMVAGIGGAVLLALPIVPSIRGVGRAEVDHKPSVESSSMNLPGFSLEAWYLPNDSLLGFVEIPDGPFSMGGDRGTDPLVYDNEGWADGRGQHIVTLPTFYIGRFEVTDAQFRAFLDATGGRARDTAATASRIGSEPAVNVSWPDAMAYARWLTRTMRESANVPPAIARLLSSGWHFTLPSEAQWEKAARGTDGRIYPWGNQPRRDRANFAAHSLRQVGAVPCTECAHGLSDMSGNVWELTRTEFRPGPIDARAEDPRADALMVMRGGSFADEERNVRTTVRGGADPGARRPFIGFRLVLTQDDN